MIEESSPFPTWKFLAELGYDSMDIVKYHILTRNVALYLFSIGRRKTVSASVNIRKTRESSGTITFSKFKGNFVFFQGLDPLILSRDSILLEIIKANPSYFRHLIDPFIALDLDYGDFDVFVSVEGGGLMGQSVAISLGVARELRHIHARLNEIVKGIESLLSVKRILIKLRKKLKVHKLLTRDPRCKERKKFGRKKARKKPQFSKR